MYKSRRTEIDFINRLRRRHRKHAVAYADQVERDYETFRIAVRNGLIRTVAGGSPLETMIARRIWRRGLDCMPRAAGNCPRPAIDKLL
jgi:hypothetical protein